MTNSKILYLIVLLSISVTSIKPQHELAPKPTDPKSTTDLKSTDLKKDLNSVKSDSENSSSSKKSKDLDLSKLINDEDLLKMLLSEDLDKPSEKAEKSDEYTYLSPYHDIKTENLPPLENFFQAKVPNKLLNLVDKLTVSTRSINIQNGLKKGLILYGPPGTGKSTIAEHLARAANRKVLFIDGGDFKTKFQGSGAERVKDLFETARKMNEPVVIVIDEIDGAATRVDSQFSTNEDNQTVKKIIGELNRQIVADDSSIYVICTTNYLDRIESSILSRFDSIEIDCPSYNSRREILKYYFKVNGIESAVSENFIRCLLTATRNWSGRDLQMMINNAVSECENKKLSPEQKSFAKFSILNAVDLKDRKIDSSLLTTILPFYIFGKLVERPTRMEQFLYSSYCQEAKRVLRERKAKPKSENSPSTFINKVGHNVAVGVLSTAVTSTMLKLGSFVINKLYSELR